MIILLIFLFLVCLYFYPMLFASSVFIERDLSAFFIPPRYLWVTLIKSFQVPLWNPYNSSGIPLLATLQTGICYPPHLFYLLLPFNLVWNWMIILHFVFSGFTVYVFLRYLKASKAASFVGGIIFMFSGYLFSIHSLLTHLLSVPWVPLVVMFFLKYLENKRTKFIIWTSIFLTMEFLAGAPEIVIMNFLILGVIVLFPQVFFAEKVDISLRLRALLFTSVIFLLLSAVQLLPFYELKSWSIRSSGLSYKEATIWSFAWKDFLLFFMPDVFGYFKTLDKYWANQSWLKTVYTGIIPFVFSLFYFVQKDKRKWLFLSIIIGSILLATGGNTPLYKFLYYIPPFNSMRYPVKFLFPFFLIISLTAGLGFDKLITGVEQKDRKIRFIIYTVFYFGFALAILWGCLNFFDSHVYKFLEARGLKPDAYNDIKFNLHNLKRFLFFSFIFSVMLLVYLRTKSKRTVMYIMMGILILDLFLANQGFYVSEQWKLYIEKKGFTEDLIANRETERYLSSNRTNQEFLSSPVDMSVGLPHYASLYGLYSTGGVEVMKVAYHNTFLQLLNSGPTISGAKRFFDICGAKYAITSYEVNDKDFRLVRSLDVDDKTAYLYEYSLYPGRFLFFTKVYYAKDDKTIIEQLQSDTFDSKKELILFGNNWASNKNTNLKGQAKLVSYKANKVILESDVDNDAFLYVSDTYYPGWRAYVDGKETKIYRANLAFRAVEVPKGKHTIVFKYVPMSFYIGLCLTIIGILLCIWLWRRDGKDNMQSSNSNDQIKR